MARYLNIFKYHLIFSLIWITFLLCTDLLVLFRYPYIFYVFNFHFSINFSCQIIIICLALRKRRRIITTLKELAVFLRVFKPARFRMFKLRFVMAIVAMVLHYILLLVLGIIGNLRFKDSQDTRKPEDQPSARRMCLQCNSTNIPMWGRTTLISVDGGLSASSYFTLCMWISTTYAVFAVLLEELVADLQLHTLLSKRNCTSQCFSILRRKLKYVYEMITTTNDLFQNVIFFWMCCTFVSFCNSVVSWLAGFESYLENKINMVLVAICSFQEVFALSIVVLVASRVHDRSVVCLKILCRFAEDAICRGLESELELIYFHLNVHKLALKASPCFLITKKMYLSFLGVGITYAIVHLQLNPKAMQALQGY